MSYRATTLERAFELARSGQCDGMEQIRARLQEEGYFNVFAQTTGPMLSAQLRQLCNCATGKSSRVIRPRPPLSPRGGRSRSNG
jgi:hypothetical protein